MRLGYACINESLRPEKYKSIKLKTFETYGITKLKEIICHNLDHLKRVLEWNVDKDIYFYRIPSDIMPLITHPKIMDTGWNFYRDEEILNSLNQIRTFKQKHSIRLTMHPDQFTVINSIRQEVIDNSIVNLNYHAKFLNLIDGDDMVIHIGGVYGDKSAAIERFKTSYRTLSAEVKSLLRIENDDKSYNIYDVLSISESLKIPVIFDFHHHRCLTKEEVTVDLLESIFDTWKSKPKVHISSGRTSEFDRSHSEYIANNDFKWVYMLRAYDIDIMLEAKGKERALLRLREAL
jgi:UV DNA damage endonuclease